MPNIDIRVLGIADWRIYKSLRLDSLLDSPDSFGSAYEIEVAYPDAEWMARLDPAGRARNALPLVAEVDGSPAGLAWGLIHNPTPEAVNVYQMWVAPKDRGYGIGRALLSRILFWAKESQLSTVLLAVTTTNSAALALYRSSGFAPLGKPEQLRRGSVLQVQPMVLRLGSTVT